MYQIVFKPSASKEFEHLPRQVQVRFRHALELLASDPLQPRPGLHIAPLHDRKREWKLRVGHYRGIYVVDADVIRFTRFGHRSTVYR